MQNLPAWFKKHVQTLAFLLTLLVSVMLIIVLWHTVSPLIIAAIFSFLLLPIVKYLNKKKCPNTMSVIISMGIACFITALIAFLLLPSVGKQLFGFTQALPDIVESLRKILHDFANKLPSFFHSGKVDMLTHQFQGLMSTSAERLLSSTMNLVPSLISLILYCFLVPILIFLFLIDRLKITDWIITLLPKNKTLFLQFCRKINHKLGHYVRGKCTEFCIVMLVSFLLYLALGLKYSMVLALGVATSVFIPLIGTILASIPIFIVGFWQWGLSDNFMWLFILHNIWLLIDSYLIVPILFGEKLDLHPAAIILAIIFFGNIWGFWGLFFAIPLATICNTLLDLLRTGKISSS